MRAIVALDSRNGIGYDGQLQATSKADLRRFKQLTLGGVIIYGRKTLQTFPGGRALPGRVNIMLSRTLEKAPPGIRLCRDLEELQRLLARLRDQGMKNEQLFVIGGTEIYTMLLPFCQEILVTRWQEALPADRFFPDFAPDRDFLLVHESALQREGERSFRYENWRRRAGILSLKAANAGLLRQLARFNPGDGLTGTRAERLEALNLESGRNRCFAVFTDQTREVSGLLRLTREGLASDADLARLDMPYALDEETLAQLLKTLFANTPEAAGMGLSLETENLALKLKRPSYLVESPLPTASRPRTLLLAKAAYYSGQTVFFYAFERGLLAVVSRAEEIVSSQLLLPGQKVSDRVLAHHLQALGLLQEQGTLSPTLPSTALSLLPLNALQEKTRDWLDNYFAGDGRLPLPPLADPALPPFQKKVVLALRDIAFGESVTYEELAARLVGNERARNYARAVGQACAANPLVLFLPCHRVLGKKGDLVGFSSGGTALKDYFLNHELQKRLNPG